MNFPRQSLVASRRLSHAFVWMALLVVTVSSGCVQQSEQEVVVYAALDKEFSQPILNQFEQETGVSVLAKFDQESNKTVGLVTTLIEQQSRPRCDIFWNNEILHTLRLQRLGLLEPLESKQADQFPEQFRASDGTWFGFAARARVLIVNTELLPEPAAWPSLVAELADKRWKNNCGIARPLFGTTASHAAVLYDQMGDRAAGFFEAVADNAVVEGGNKQVAQHVAEGKYAWGITDTDDAIIELESGKPVAIVLPDQGPADSGCLLIPNTLARIKRGPNPDHAARLVDFLLTTRVEEQLATGPSAQIPLHLHSDATSRAIEKAVRVTSDEQGAGSSQEVRWMQVDFEAAAEKWESSRAVLERLFPTGG